MKRALIVAVVTMAVSLGAGAQATMPSDWGTGWYWTDFTTEFGTQPFTAGNWTVLSTDGSTATFTVSGGALAVTCANSLDRPAAFLFDPGVDYSKSGTQEVLIRISASNFNGNLASGGSGDSRAGAIVRTSLNTGDHPYYSPTLWNPLPPQRFSGYNLTFRNFSAPMFWLNRTRDNAMTNDDGAVSYENTNVYWDNTNPGQWFWMRIVSDETSTYARVWLDGDDEPSAWSTQREWVWNAGTADGSGVSPDGGLAGILANGNTTFQVSHFQLKVDENIAALPRVPEPATMTLLVLGGLAMLRRRRK